LSRAETRGSNLGHRFYATEGRDAFEPALTSWPIGTAVGLQNKDFLQKERAKVGSFAALPFVGFIGFVHHSVRPNAALF
jgi:hypothetical protein